PCRRRASGRTAPGTRTPLRSRRRCRSFPSPRLVVYVVAYLVEGALDLAHDLGGVPLERRLHYAGEHERRELRPPPRVAAAAPIDAPLARRDVHRSAGDADPHPRPRRPLPHVRDFAAAEPL